MGALVTTSIFEKNNEILYVTKDNFNTILGCYRVSLEGLDMETVLNPTAIKEMEDCTKKVKKLLSLQKFNEYFEHMIDIEQVSSLQRRPTYDLTLQAEIQKIVVNWVLPILSDKTFLPGFEESAKQPSQILRRFKFMLKTKQGRFDEGELEEVHKEEYSLDEIKYIVFELCYSFLKLFNKASSRMIFTSTYQFIKDKITQEFLAGMKYLYGFEEGVVVMTEVIRLYNYYFCFFNNHLINFRVESNKYVNVTRGFERAIPLSHCTATTTDTNIFVNIIRGLQEIEKWTRGGDSSLKMHIEKHLFVGIFQITYKFVKGVSTQYFVNTKVKNTDDKPHLCRSIRQIYRTLISLEP